MGRLRWASVFLHLRSVSGYCYLVTNAFIEAKPGTGSLAVLQGLPGAHGGRP